MVQLNVSIDFKNVKTIDVHDGATVESISPQPAQMYTAVYNRIVLSNTFVVSSLKDKEQIDFLTTNPPVINVSNDIVTLDASSMYSNLY